VRRIVVALAATSMGVALVVGAKAQSAGAPRSALAGSGPVGAGPGAGAGGTSGGGSGSASGGGGASGGASGSASASASGGGKAAATGSFTGSAVGTRYGTMQVQAVMKDGRLSSVGVLQQTDGGRSSMIDSYALPILTAEALKAQGANIDVVSGATYTSDGYAQSLQAALDAAAGR
jgi:uncharacterized protein with FMN-binding domain